MKPSDIFRWRQISTALSGNTESVRSDHKSDKYSEAYQELIDFSKTWLEKHEKKKDNPKQDAQ